MEDMLNSLDREDLREIKEQTKIIAGAKNRRNRILADKDVNDPLISLILSWWDDLRHMTKEEKIRTLRDIMPLGETRIREIVDKLGLE
jgi:hypothetical protein